MTVTMILWPIISSVGKHINGMGNEINVSSPCVKDTVENLALVYCGKYAWCLNRGRGQNHLI